MKIQGKCQTCTKVFSYYKSKTKGKFCSRRCSAQRPKSKKWKIAMQRQRGLLNPFFGRHHTKNTKMLLKEIGKKGSWVKRGALSPFWAGGINTYQRKLYLNNIRRTLKQNCTEHHTEDEWIALKRRYSHVCPSCLRQEPEISLTRDHITPLTKNGDDTITNIQPLCKSCNSKKSTRLIFYPIYA